jgi:hypothetical protein
MSADAQPELKTRIDTIESAYEFMLAYAAQGREKDNEGPEIRQYLKNLYESLEGIGTVSTKCFSEGSLVESNEAIRANIFIDVLVRDSKKAQAGIGLVQAQSQISSQLIDNLNASSHLRALLTDLFLLDEVLK